MADVFAWEKMAEQWVPTAITERPDITSADALYAYMRESGAYVPRSFVREQWGTIKTEQGYAPIINRLEDDQIIPRNWYKDTSFEYQESYVWKIEVTGHIAETGEPSKRIVTIESAENLTIGEVLDNAFDWINLYGFEMLEETPQTEIVEFIHVPGTPW